MSKILSPQFRVNLAEQFKESFDEPANTIFFTTAHRNVPFADDATPPSIKNSIFETHYDLHNSLLFGKHVVPGDTAFMIQRNTWESDTQYAQYNDKDGDLQNKNFFIVTESGSTRHVFKCLHNNFGANSTTSPTFEQSNPADEIYITDDKYQWKYLYSIPGADWDKFTTANFIPAIPNANVVTNSVGGAIDHIQLVDGGSRNNNFANGTFREVSVGSNNLIHSIESEHVLSANTDFYKNASIYIKSGAGDGQIRNIQEYIVTGSERRILIDREFDTYPVANSEFEITPRVIISGDGANCLARSEIDPNGNTVSNIIVLDRGADYTFADVQVVANTGLVGVDSITSVDAVATISPPGGHGSNILSELYATRIAISVDFNADEGGDIPAQNDYRIVGLLKEPRFEQGILGISSTGGDSPLSFHINENVVQDNTGASGTISNRELNTITLSNIRGFFDGESTITGVSSNASGNVESSDRSFQTINQSHIFNVEITSAGPSGSGFDKDEEVIQVGVGDVASNILKLTVGIDPLEFDIGETITQANTGAEAVVSNRTREILTISNVSGSFATGNTILNYITGSNSNANTSVTNIDSTIIARATGNIYTLNSAGANSTIIGLSNVRGNFALSDDETNTINTFRGQKTQAVAKLVGRNYSKNHIVNNSGEFMYVENFIPVTRSSTQLERIKLIIEF